MAAERERVGRLRRLLEPLAVLYEKTVLEANKEPFEVRFKIQQSTDHLMDDDHVANTFHIIDGGSLQAAHEVWQEFRRLEMARRQQSD